MIIGRGLLARAMASLAGNNDVVIFASGVSDSGERDPAEFAREEKLIRETLSRNSGKLFVYFSTCSIADPESNRTPYVQHKLRMEHAITSQARRYLIFRLPQLVGKGGNPATLINYLYERILHGQPFDLWVNAVRHVIDVDDVARVVEHGVKGGIEYNTIVEVASRPYTSREIVHALETITGKQAICREVERGSSYTLNSAIPSAQMERLGISFGPDYLDRTLKKYLSPDREQVPELISIVVAVRNGAQTIGNLLQGIAEQRTNGVEVIVVDGGSTDATMEIVKAYGTVVSRYVSEKDHGIYDAWNKGIRMSRGNWIAFMGADDTYAPGGLDTYINYLKRNRTADLDFVSSRVELVNHQGHVFHTIGKPWDWRRFRKYMNIAHPGAIHHRRLFERFGMFDSSYKIAGDYEFLLRANDTLKAGFIDQVTVRMKAGGVSVSSIKVFDETYRAKRTTGKLSLFRCRLDKGIALAKYMIRNLVWARHLKA